MTCEHRNELFAALANAQGAFPPIGKDKSARIALKTGGSYQYTYADLATVFAAIRPALSANGLALIQRLTFDQEAGDVSVETVLGHSSGQSLDSLLRLPVGDPRDPRSVASAITYARRYGVLAMVGVAPADEDDDAEAAHVSRWDPPDATPVPVTASLPALSEPAPAGYYYLEDYGFDDGWHRVTIPHADAQGGALLYKTKIGSIGAAAAQAFRDHVPVRLEGKPSHDPGQWWLDKVVPWEPEHEEADRHPRITEDSPF